MIRDDVIHDDLIRDDVIRDDVIRDDVIRDDVNEQLKQFTQHGSRNTVHPTPHAPCSNSEYRHC